MMRQGCKRGGRRALADSWWIAVPGSGGSGGVDRRVRDVRARPLPTEEKVKVVTERAAARWKAIIGKDFAAAYEYMSPASRATVTPAGFKTIASRLDYRDAEVTGGDVRRRRRAG